jgi:hypothetical protein
MVANRADPTNWRCTEAPWTSPDPKLNRPAWTPPKGQKAHSGITVWGDRSRAWVGTRSLWNQHSYHVTNICDSRDDACQIADNLYGAVPKQKLANWSIPWLNNFRQNVQGDGLFDAPDATVSLNVGCQLPMTLQATVRNLGRAPLPKGVEVGFYIKEGGTERLIAKATTDRNLFPGQGAVLRYQVKDQDNAPSAGSYVARILVDPQAPRFRECRDQNNASNVAKNPCLLQ